MTETLSGSFTFTGTSEVSSGTASSTDSRTGLTVASTSTPSGTSGKLTQSGNAVGTFSVDANGNGSIAYSDGTLGGISGYRILQ